MSIDPKRLENAAHASWEADTVGSTARERWDNAVRAALEADDQFRAKQELASPPLQTISDHNSKIGFWPRADIEPELPNGVAYRPDDFTNGCTYHARYQKRSLDLGQLEILSKHWSPEELRAIADHMDYRDRQRTREQEAAKVTPSGAAYNAVFERLRESDLPAITKVELAEAIEDAFAAFLEAQRREAGKGGDHA